MNNAPFTISNALAFAFRTYGRNFWLLLGTAVLYFTIQMTLLLSMQLVLYVAGIPSSDTTDADNASMRKTVITEQYNTEEGNWVSKSTTTTTRQTVPLPSPSSFFPSTAPKFPEGLAKTMTGGQMVATFILILMWLFAMAIHIFFLMGWNRFTLDLAYNGGTNFRRLLASLPLFGTYLLTYIMYNCIWVGGLLLLIVPAIIWGIKYSLFDFIVLDTDSGPVEVLRHSATLTYGYKWYLFLFELIVCLITFLSSVTVIGPYLLVPVWYLARAYIYSKLQEQWRLQYESPVPFMP